MKQMADTDSLFGRLLRAHGYAVLVIGSFLGLIPFALIRAVGASWRWPSLANLESTDVAGAVLASAGGSLSYLCMILFVVRGRGTAFPTDPPQVFVATGPYRWVRNPMYLGNAVLAVGIGLLLSSPAYLSYTAALILVTHFYIVRVEEPRLRLRFGETYESYCGTTARWLPRRPATQPQ